MTWKETMDYIKFAKKLDKLALFKGKSDEQIIAIIKENKEKILAKAKAMMTDNLGGVSVGFGKSKVGVNWADNSLTCDSEGNCMLKDKLIKFGGSIGKFSANFSTADNALTCDSEGNCMLKDKLWKMPKISATGSYGGVSGSISTADNALTCDSEGNCMLKDKLLSFGGSYKGNSV